MLGGGLLGIYLPIGVGVQVAFFAGFQNIGENESEILSEWIGGGKT
jgi:hypothetical protein